MDTASCTSTLTEWTQEAGESNPSNEVTQLGAVGNLSSMLIHPFDVIALEHGYVHKLARLVVTVMLDNEQSWSRYLKHETQARYCARRPPDSQFFLADARHPNEFRDARRPGPLASESLDAAPAGARI